MTCAMFNLTYIKYYCMVRAQYGTAKHKIFLHGTIFKEIYPENYLHTVYLWTAVSNFAILV